MTIKKQLFPTVWIIFILFTLITYTLPWVVGGGASLTFGAFDLAEWASLHPATRAMSPILLTSFLLRFPLVCLAWIVAFNAPPYPFKSANWWFYGVICLILVIFSTPPLEFLTTNRDDMNYLQQAGLSVLGIIGCAIGLSGVLKPYRHYIAVVMSLIGAIVSVWGVILAYSLLADFQISISVGIGIIACTGMFILMAGYNVWLESKRRR